MNTGTGKGILQSKTQWVAILTFLVGLLTYLKGDEFVSQNPEIVSYIGMALGVVIFILRLLTNQPINVGKKPDIKILLLVGFLLTGTGIAYAQSAAAVGSSGVTLNGFAPSTTYLVQITTDAQGQIEEVSRVSPFPVVDVSKLPTTGGGDTTPTDPGPTTGFRQRLDAALQTVNDPVNARKLGVAYAVVLTGEYENMGAIQDAASKVRQSLVGNLAEWEPFNRVLRQEAYKAAQEDKLSTAEDYAAIITVARDALLQAGNAAGQFDVDSALELVRLVMDIIKDGDGVSLPGILEIVKLVLRLI